VNQFNPSIQSLFDVLASEMQSRLLKGHSGDVRVSWAGDSADRTPSDLIWWSWSLSIDSACRVVAGASWTTWKEICGLDAEVAPADFGDVIQEAARNRFGSEVTCGEAESSEEPPREWTSISFSIESSLDAGVSVYFSISPDLEAAMGGSATDTEGSKAQDLAPRMAARNSADILMHVEMPVTIILGSTKMRLKELLKLTDGSVVELDQMLEEEVEVRVNNCVIAYGEVVAVDGNYAVRILRMAPARNAPDLRGELPEKAA
jgi:flagellar motor switch protein FliN